MASLITPRHIQNFSDAASLEPHWGYADRVLPCTNDPGSCAYLDLVYGAHDVGMLYMGIMWALIGGILLIWALGRLFFHSRTQHGAFRVSTLGGNDESQVATAPKGGLVKLGRTIAAASRRHLLPESIQLVFGHTTRLQVAVLGIVSSYLTVFTFAGMYYTTWITPVKGMPGVYNTRTTLGPWSDRIGLIAYALTPLSILLSSRESILSLLTAIPYQSFLFMHRWLGYIIFAQSALHTIGWCVVEIRLYQPQPSVAMTWIVQTYMVWGLVAMALLTILFLLSTPWAIRAFGYEFFRKAHYILAMIYIGACIGHWENLQCFLIPGIVIWVIDRIARLIRTALMHYNYLPDGSLGFTCAHSQVSHFPDPENGDVVRLDFSHPQQPWAVGQHFFLCFPELSIWQSHPMTPLSPPLPKSGWGRGGVSGSTHSYVIRAKAGETHKLAVLAAKKLAAGAGSEKKDGANSSSSPMVSVILTGPYGDSITGGLGPGTNVLCVAGGTGVTFVLPILLEIARASPVPGRKIDFVWAVRRHQDMEWVASELAELRATSETHGIHIDVFVTRECRTTSRRALSSVKNTDKGTAVTEAASSSSSSSQEGEESVEEEDHVAVHRPADVESPEVRRPHVKNVVEGFVAGTAQGPTVVFASGPLGMVADLREAVAQANSASRVWRGEARFDVKLVCDDRAEW